MTLSAFGIFLYTTLGAVIGAGLTQYVTHLRDRRAARATIIEKLAAAEGEYAALTGKSVESLADQENPSFSEFNRVLASVEAACLIAGVPRANVTTYIISRQVGARVASFRYVTMVASREAGRRRQAIEAGLLGESAANLDEGLSLARTLQAVFDELDGSCDHLTSIAFNELMRSIWHPFVVHLRKSQLHKLQQQVKDIEASLREAERGFKRVQFSAQKLESKWHKDIPSPDNPDHTSPSIQ